MMKIYAQVDENGICIGISTLSGVVDAPHMIALETEDASLLGATYTDGEWVPAVPDVAPLPLTVLQFRNRFTLMEKSAIYTAAESEVLIKIWLDDLAAASFVQLEDPAIIQGVHGLVAAGIITEERANEILTV